MVRGQFSGGNCMGGNFPRVQLSSGAIVRGAIFLGCNYPRGQLSGGGQSSKGQLSRGQFSSGAIVLEPFFSPAFIRFN